MLQQTQLVVSPSIMNVGDVINSTSNTNNNGSSSIASVVNNNTSSVSIISIPTSLPSLDGPSVSSITSNQQSVITKVQSTATVTNNLQQAQIHHQNSISFRNGGNNQEKHVISTNNDHFSSPSTVTPPHFSSLVQPTQHHGLNAATSTSIPGEVATIGGIVNSSSSF